MANSDRRHRLLIYARLYAPWRAPALLIALACLTLAGLAPGPLAEVWMRLALLVGAGAGLLLFIFGLVGPHLSYVQCRPTHLRVSTPLYQLAISYSRIYTCRPVPFDPAQSKWSRSSLARPFLGKTLLAVDLRGYPVSLRWLRLLLHPLLLPDNFQGLQFLVADWMALSRDIEVHRTQWQMRHHDRSRGEALTSLTMPRR